MHNKRAPNVEIGESPGQPHVEPIQTGDGVAKGVTRKCGRARVNALAPGISALNLETMAHALRQLQFESINVGAPLIEHATNVAKVGIDRSGGSPCVRSADEVATGIYLRPQISAGGFRRAGRISILHAEVLMYAAQTLIGNHS